MTLDEIHNDFQTVVDAAEKYIGDLRKENEDLKQQLAASEETHTSKLQSLLQRLHNLLPVEPAPEPAPDEMPQQSA